MRERDEAEFRDFVIARSMALRRTAYLLCGDWHQAEDIVQTALTKLYVAWRRVHSRDGLDAYVRQIVVRCYLDERRRAWRRELPAAMPPETAVHDEPGFEERSLLLTALAYVPPRQRAALVLRFWEDQSVEATALALGCTPGTVKSQTARGLETLRGLLDRSPDLRPYVAEGRPA